MNAVGYVLVPGESVEENGPPRSFYIKVDERSGEMLLMTYRPLDYETVPRYVLTVKATVLPVDGNECLGTCGVAWTVNMRNGEQLIIVKLK